MCASRVGFAAGIGRLERFERTAAAEVRRVATVDCAGEVGLDAEFVRAVGVVRLAEVGRAAGIGR